MRKTILALVLAATAMTLISTNAAEARWGHPWRHWSYWRPWFPFYFGWPFYWEPFHWRPWPYYHRRYVYWGHGHYRHWGYAHRGYAHWGARGEPAIDAILGAAGAALLLAYFFVSEKLKGKSTG